MVAKKEFSVYNMKVVILELLYLVVPAEWHIISQAVPYLDQLIIWYKAVKHFQWRCLLHSNSLQAEHSSMDSAYINLTLNLTAVRLVLTADSI